MKHYHHLTIIERESIWEKTILGESARSIGRSMEISHTTVLRELARNSSPVNNRYRPSTAQAKYKKRRKNCRKKALFEDSGLYNAVRKYIVELSWSPEEISQRLKLENNEYQISYTTIYRAINRRLFDEKNVKDSMRGFKQNLRKHGKPYRKGKGDEKRGKINISNSIEDRPATANDRLERGHWEADTVLGTRRSGCVVTLVDRYSRYLLGKKLSSFSSTLVADAMISLFKSVPIEYVKSITPDQGKEFTEHPRVSSSLSAVPFYFAHPHSPWEKPSVENTNGLLREYMPKRTSFTLFSVDFVQQKIDKMNLRPRKCLGWKTPFEVFFDVVVHLT